MKAYIYDVRVSTIPVHEWGDVVIKEIWIPGVNIALNNKGYSFKCEEPRNNVGDKIEIDISDEDFDILKRYTDTYDELQFLAKKLFSEQ